MSARCFSTQPYDPSKILIETDQLKQLMDDGHENLNVLHAMVEPPDTANKDPKNDLTKYYQMMNRGFIPTAHVFPLIPFGDMDSGLNLTMPKQERFRQVARQLDLRVNDTFVCYDAGTVHASARLAWVLKGYGAKNVHVLNGTYDKWVRDKFEVSTEYNPDSAI